MNGTILSCLKEGDFTLHSGQKSKYIFDIMELIRNCDWCEEFYQFVDNNFIVGIEFGGAILAALNGGNRNKNFTIIRKDRTIYGSPISKNFVLLDDVVTTESSLRTAMKQIYDKTGFYPEEIKCIVDRRSLKDRYLHIESMLEITEEQLMGIKPKNIGKKY